MDHIEKVSVELLALSLTNNVRATKIHAVKDREGNIYLFPPDDIMNSYFDMLKVYPFLDKESIVKDEHVKQILESAIELYELLKSSLAEEEEQILTLLPSGSYGISEGEEPVYTNLLKYLNKAHLYDLTISKVGIDNQYGNLASVPIEPFAYTMWEMITYTRLKEEEAYNNYLTMKLVEAGTFNVNAQFFIGSTLTVEISLDFEGKVADLALGTKGNYRLPLLGADLDKYKAEDNYQRRINELENQLRLTLEESVRLRNVVAVGIQEEINLLHAKVNGLDTIR